MSEETSVDQAVDYSKYKDKMVTLTLQGRDEPFAARVVEGNDMGIMYKEKNQRVPQIASADDILSIEEAVSPRLRLVTKKKLRAVSEPTIKRHLADYHGLTLTELNGMSEGEALRRHDEIDHSDLGHEHSDEVASASQAAPRESREDILRRISAA
ncbi:hypothetical protein [Streptomyces sp. NPDC127100]|uniref:hypothetical protein n=1 Tax=Streptomyces sp. NPDC127100 TaxID=3347138 RepID=UPI00364F1193